MKEILEIGIGNLKNANTSLFGLEAYNQKLEGYALAGYCAIIEGRDVRPFAQNGKKAYDSVKVLEDALSKFRRENLTVHIGYDKTTGNTFLPVADVEDIAQRSILGKFLSEDIKQVGDYCGMVVLNGPDLYRDIFGEHDFNLSVTFEDVDVDTVAPNQRHIAFRNSKNPQLGKSYIDNNIIPCRKEDGCQEFFPDYDKDFWMFTENGWLKAHVTSEKKSKKGKQTGAYIGNATQDQILTMQDHYRIMRPTLDDILEVTEIIPKKAYICQVIKE